VKTLCRKQLGLRRAVGKALGMEEQKLQQASGKTLSGK
jgi:hypothetical protein